MAGETILIIDAGQDIDQRMTTTLEAEGYLVYTVSSQDVSVETAELLRPSLIYIKPLELSPAGFKPCKAIHNIPPLKKVPILILASLKKALGPQFFKDYGIVDFMDPTFGPEELIEKTATMLGKPLPSRRPKEHEPAASPRRVRRMEKKRPALLLPAIGLVTLLVIAGAGFMTYQQFMPASKVPPSPAVTAPLRVPSAAPEAASKSQLLPVRNDAETSAPASSVSSPPHEQLSSLPSTSVSQPPSKPFYSVQLGAFKKEEGAHALAKKFQEKGYDAFIQPGATNDRTPIYRVLVSRYEDRKAATKLAGEIESREGIKTTLYHE